MNVARQEAKRIGGWRERLALTELNNIIFLVAMRSGDTPVPIPNTMVKTWPADGTALETVWESRWPPDLKKKEGLIAQPVRAHA